MEMRFNSALLLSVLRDLGPNLKESLPSFDKQWGDTAFKARLKF